MRGGNISNNVANNYGAIGRLDNRNTISISGGELENNIERNIN